jgi:uncharacterized membrane protein
MQARTSVAEVERWTSALSGAALTVIGVRRGIRQRSIGGAMLAAAGTSLIYHAAVGVKIEHGDTRVALAGSRGVNLDEAVTINRPAEELYAFWRDFERLPQFMQHLVSVTRIDARRSHWVAKALAGRTIEWDAEIINDIPNEVIAWRSLEGSDVVSAGSVHFKRAPGGRGTVLRVRLQYNPPGGKAGAAIASMLGHDPAETIREDLRRLKQLMEAGEVPITEGQSRGARRFTSVVFATERAAAGRV